MGSIKLHPTRCAICNTEGETTELYPANFDLQAFNQVVFSARRLPDRIHYRMVKCITCGLVRADPVVDSETLTELYAQSSFDYSDEVINLKSTYGRYLAKLVKYGAKKGALLEVGCGNGFFLEEALAQGYAIVRGVEPSATALSRADPQLRQSIICNVMSPGLFKAGQFDVICMFQIFDHIPDPGLLLAECFRVLKPGGLILCLNHNIEAWPAKIFKNRSPIIDIEHTCLYSPTTMTRIFAKYGFKVRNVGSAYNKYTLYYLMRFIPFPALLKRVILASLKRSFVGRIRMLIPLGNLYLIAQRPDRGDH